MFDPIFEARPGMALLVVPENSGFTMVAVSQDFLYQTGLEKKDVINKAISELFFSSYLLPSLELVIKKGVKQELPAQHYEMKSAGIVREMFWKLVITPVYDHLQLTHLILTAEEGNPTADKRSADLRQIEKAYHVFMQAPVIVGILRGGDYKIDLANEALLEVWGREPDVIGKPLLQALPELEEQGFITLLNQVRESGEPFYAYEFPIVLNRNGQPETLYFDFVYKAIYDDADSKIASGIISVGHEVTARITARRRLEESESKYKELFNSMDEGFCLVEVLFDENNQPVNYRFLETNPVFEKQTGLSNANGKTVLELVPNLEKHWFELYGRVATTGEPIQFVEGSDAMGRWFDVYAFRMGGSGSRNVALLFTDVTEKRKGEEALKQSERNLRNTILQAPVSMSILRGENFVVEIANDRMFELWGRTSEELLGKPLFEGLPEVRDQGFEELLAGVFTTGKEFSAHSTPVKLPRDGQVETVYCNFLYTPFREGDGSISGIIVVAIEVTEQVKARQQIEDQV
ncbi:MAG: PAS domain S-box protein, partial [Flavisolibacter sp.]